jgi:hypothetical protein
MSANVKTTQLTSCGCAPKFISASNNDKEYIEVMKTFLDDLTKQLILHSHKDLVNIKPCYGKQHTSVASVSSILKVHSTILKRLKTNVEKREHLTKRPAFMRLRKPVYLKEYVNCFYMLTQSFQSVLSTFFNPTDILPIPVYIDSAKGARLSLGLLDHFVNDNGGGFQEIERTTSEDGSVQLESTVTSSV